MSKKFDLIVLGSGPGGYVTAIRASQLGLKTAIVEKESLGGVCLNWGCIPTKALLKSAQVFEYLKKADSYGLKIKDFDKDFDAVVKRSRDVADGMSKGVNFLMKKNKIEIINGYGKVLPNKKVSVEDNGTVNNFEADNIIIATGGRSRVIDSIPQDGKKIIGYREAMTLKKQPKKMIIVGSGAIGIEFAYFYNSMGTEVKIVEYMDRILPVEDKDISNQLKKTFKKSGIEILTNSEVISSDTKGKGVKVQIKSNGQISEHEADYNFMFQTLTGDKTDNYAGCPSIGPKTAEKILSGADTLDDMWAAVTAAYAKQKLSTEVALQQAQVARICRASDFNFKTKKVIPWTPPI